MEKKKKGEKCILLQECAFFLCISLQLVIDGVVCICFGMSLPDQIFGFDSWSFNTTTDDAWASDVNTPTQKKKKHGQQNTDIQEELGSKG